MPNTTNFNWNTPADTDLVKDGAAAIRTLGNNIDASLVDLKGGTTGQVLAKATNADLDFTWTDGGDITSVSAGVGISGGGTSGAVTITNSMATAIDAKGDLVAGTGADAFARLAVGANNTVLTADSATATGLKWATVSSGANWTLLNAGGTALTGAQTITVSGISAVDKILVLITGASSVNASSQIAIRLNTDTGNNYNYNGFYIIASSTYQVGNLEGLSEVNRSSIQLARLSDSASSVAHGGLLITGCNASGVKVFQGSGGGTVAASNNHSLYSHSGFYNSSSTISSVSAFSTNGNFDAGTIFVYTSA